MFGENLKKIMSEKGLSVTKVSQLSGVGKSSISQYLSGKNIPTSERIKVLADAIGCTVEELIDTPTVKTVVEQTGSNTEEVFNVPVELAAKLMHKSNKYVYDGLKRGDVFKFGNAVKTSTQWSYFISSKKFTEETGIPVDVSMIYRKKRG